MTAPAWPGGRPDTIHEFFAQLSPGDVGEWLGTFASRRETGRLLYVGIGTGRRALHLALAGWDVHGVERDAEPLEQLWRRLDQDPAMAAARERLTVEHAPVEESAADGPFDAVMLPDVVFSLTTEPGGQRELLAACAKRCRPGGLVVLDLANPVPYHAAALGAGVVYEAGPLADADVGYEAAWRTTRLLLKSMDVRAQTFDCEPHYAVEYPDGDRREFVDPHGLLRWVSPAELRAMGDDAGLRLLGGSFDRVDVPVWRVVFRPA